MKYYVEYVDTQGQLKQIFASGKNRKDACEKIYDLSSVKHISVASVESIGEMLYKSEFALHKIHAMSPTPWQFVHDDTWYVVDAQGEIIFSGPNASPENETLNLLVNFMNGLWRC